VGLAASLVSGALGLLGGEGALSVYRTIRAVFARSILLGLEFLVAADIIRTVAVQPSLENVAVLGLAPPVDHQRRAPERAVKTAE
jgi:hypothetical protein